MGPGKYLKERVFLFVACVLFSQCSQSIESIEEGMLEGASRKPIETPTPQQSSENEPQTAPEIQNPIAETPVAPPPQAAPPQKKNPPSNRPRINPKPRPVPPAPAPNPIPVPSEPPVPITPLPPTPIGGDDNPPGGGGNFFPNVPPIANAGADQNAKRLSILNFDASGSMDSNGNIISYLWNFGDGTSAEGMQVSHAYQSVGSFLVQLTVTDSGGLSSNDSAMVNISLRDMIVPWSEFNIPFADVTQEPLNLLPQDGAVPGLLLRDFCLEGLEYWSQATDRVIITTRDGQLQNLYPYLMANKPPSVQIIGGTKTFTLPGSAHYNPATYDFADGPGWEFIAQEVQRIAQITGVPIVVLDNETSLMPFHQGLEEIDLEKLKESLKPLRDTGIEIWMWLPMVVRNYSLMPDQMSRTIPLVIAVRDALPNCKFLTPYKAWYDWNFDSQVAARNAMIDLVGLEKMQEGLYISRTGIWDYPEPEEDLRCYSPEESLVMAQQANGEMTRVYMTQADWIVVGQRFANLLAGPTSQMISSNPASGSIDAREPLSASAAAGWNSIDIQFSSSVAEMNANQFLVTQIGASGHAPMIQSLQVMGSNSIRLQLSSPIRPLAWTDISYIPSNQKIRLGYLPGDVGGEGVTTGGDILSLINALNGVSNLPLHSTDIDRSGSLNVLDVNRLLELLQQGVPGVYAPFEGQALP